MSNSITFGHINGKYSPAEAQQLERQSLRLANLALGQAGKLAATPAANDLYSAETGHVGVRNLERPFNAPFVPAVSDMRYTPGTSFSPIENLGDAGARLQGIQAQKAVTPDGNIVQVEHHRTLGIGPSTTVVQLIQGPDECGFSGGGVTAQLTINHNGTITFSGDKNTSIG